MTRFLTALVLILLAVSAAEAAHRSLFGIRIRERVVVRERAVIRPLAAMRGASCIGTVRGGCAGVTVSGGCSGWAGPALAVPSPAVVPGVMPARPYWPGTAPWKK